MTAPYGRTLAVWVALVGATSVAAAAVHAADAYPTRPVRLLVGFAPGGANDLVARTVANRLSPRLGQQVVVENRPGAGGNIATELASRAAPDGYTMLLASVSSFGMGPALLGKVPYDPVNDFAPITQAVWVTALLSVHPSMPAKSLQQYVALAKRQPGSITYATPGFGSIAHMASELFWKTAGVRVNHVPYKGGNPASADAIAGHVDSMFSLISTQVPHVRAGRLRALAVSSAQRSAALPDVPTIAERGYPGFEASGWLGFAFPAKTPRAIVERMQREIVAVVQLREVQSQLEGLGLDTHTSDPAKFQDLIRSDRGRWEQVVKDAGLRVKR